jgi:hypothetical protein
MTASFDTHSSLPSAEYSIDKGSCFVKGVTKIRALGCLPAALPDYSTIDLLARQCALESG